ncbi:hypothetical protein CG017_05869 (plasmid) [Burkholderia glumae]|nr:hypothetical protein CG017_05869 [Burkholderia glumae]
MRAWLPAEPSKREAGALVWTKTPRPRRPQEYLEIVIRTR